MTDPVTPPTDADNDLDEWLAQRAAEIDNEPDDLAPIDRALGVCRYLDRQRAEIEATYASRVAELATWRDQRFAVLDNRRTRIAAQLEGWARAMHERSGGRVKTWKLANGTIEIRAADDVVHFEENAAKTGRRIAAAGWPSMVVDKVEASKTRISTQLDDRDDLVLGPAIVGYELPKDRHDYTAHPIIAETGEVIPGVVVLRPSRPRFNLRPTLPARGSDHDPAADAGGLELPEVTQ